MSNEKNDDPLLALKERVRQPSVNLLVQHKNGKFLKDRKGPGKDGWIWGELHEAFPMDDFCAHGYAKFIWLDGDPGGYPKVVSLAATIKQYEDAIAKATNNE